MRSLPGALVSLVVALVVIAVIVAIPLLTVYQARCREGGELRTRYVFVPPWDERAENCNRYKNGLALLADFADERLP